MTGALVDLSRVAVKGKSVPVEVYEVYSANHPKLQARKTITLKEFEEATRLFVVKEFVKARALFEEVLKELPGDLATKSYILRCDRHMNRELPEDWDGALDFDFK